MLKSQIPVHQSRLMSRETP